MASVSVMSWNVWGLNSATKRSLVFKYLQRYNPHICVFQETHLIGNRILGLKRAWVGAHYHSTFSNYARGVSILVHKSLPLQIMNIRTDPGGRFVIIHVVVYTKQMVLVGLYIPLLQLCNCYMTLCKLLWVLIRRRSLYLVILTWYPHRTWIDCTQETPFLRIAELGRYLCSY